MSEIAATEELRNELVIEGTRIGVWDWNIQTGETYFNERWAEIIGYTVEELNPVSIETWMKYAHPDDLEKSNELLEAHFAGKTDYYDFKTRMKHKNGHWVWVHDRGKVFEWDKEGNPLRMCGSHMDITLEKEREIELKKAIQEKEILLKEVHHRVKNNLQLLLSLSRLKDKKGKIETLQLEDSINSIASAYEAIYRSDEIKNISIEQYLRQIMTPIVYGQEAEFVLNAVKYTNNIDFLIPIGLVATELMNNSLKYGGVPNSKLKISLNITKENNKLRFIYSDNGSGYPNEIIKKGVANDSFGISIISGLVDQLNGVVRFFNENGAVTEIIIQI